MTDDTKNAVLEAAERWWSTSIIDIHPGEIDVRGYPIEQLIGAISFPQMIWLMVRGELPTKGQARLLEAALVASVDHGPHAPSIAISRMAVSCGAELNNAMASAINVLADVHGGAGQQCMDFYQMIRARIAAGFRPRSGNRRRPASNTRKGTAPSSVDSATVGIQSTHEQLPSLALWRKQLRVGM